MKKTKGSQNKDIREMHVALRDELMKTHAASLSDQLAATRAVEIVNIYGEIQY